MVAQHSIWSNALDFSIGHVDGVNIAKESIGRVLCQGGLKLGVSLSPSLRVVGLPGLGQGLVHQLVGVPGVVGPLACAEHLICVVVRIEGRAPANDTALLPCPVNAPAGISAFTAKPNSESCCAAI